MRFEYYVLNYNTNSKKVEFYNVFNNIYVQECTEKEIKKYLRSPSKYESYDLCGFDGLCEKIRRIIMWQEWSRCEYEMGVCNKFETDINKIQHTDCYEQCVPNISIIVRECIYQYKKQKKGK